MRRAVAIGALASAVLLAGCTSGDDAFPPETPFDASVAIQDGAPTLRDSATHEASLPDASTPDATDATIPQVDSSTPDAADAGADANADAATDADAADDAAADAIADAADASLVCGSGAASNAAAWWPAEGNANDATGSYDGSLAGGATFGTGPAGLGQAFSVNGTTAYVAVPDGIIPPTTRGFTVAAWFNATSLPTTGQGMIFYGGGNNGELSLALEKDGTVGCALKLASDQQWHGANATPAVTLGDWHLAICVDDGTSLTMWLDGVSTTPSAIPDSDLFVIGGFPSSIGAYAQDMYSSNLQSFTGLIDEVRLYRRALTSNELATYAQGCTLPPPGDAGVGDAGGD